MGAWSRGSEEANPDREILPERGGSISPYLLKLFLCMNMHTELCQSSFFDTVRGIIVEFISGVRGSNLSQAQSRTGLADIYLEPAVQP
jgi:hypothetical protein